VHALGELLDDLGVEGFEVVWFPAGNESLINVYFLVDPVGPGTEG